MNKETLTVTDNRTGKTYEIPIYRNAAIRAMDLRQIKVSEDDFGLMGYDPAFTNTASCSSKITFIDGDRGILRYRGYPIQQVAERSNYLETAYLVLYGELPTKAQLDAWTRNIALHTAVPDNLKCLIETFPRDAHPMGLLQASVAALGTFYPDARNIRDAESRQKQTYRLIGQVATLAAYGYRHRHGLPFVDPDPDLSYTGNFLSMLWKTTEAKYKPNPVLERALDILFMLHADHEQNCSASTMRTAGSSHTDPFAATAGAIGALYGPLHGGANEEVLRMLAEIGSKDKVSGYIERVKKGEFLLMGFGHRIYKNYDPRAEIIKRTADQVFEVTGRNPLLDIALELERIAIQDEYFVKRRLYPNVDFYSGIIYQAMGFPTEMFTVLFAIPRTSGWLAQWLEMLQEPGQKIARPRQVFEGYDERPYVPLEQRTAAV